MTDSQDTKRGEIERKVMDEFALARELGDWYQDAPVFGRHQYFNLIVNSLIDSRLEAASLREQLEAANAENQRLKQAALKLLEWMPTCSEGSSGRIRMETLRKLCVWVKERVHDLRDAF